MSEPNTPQWHIYDGKEQQGPLTEEDIRAGIRQGRYASNCLIWREGMLEWQPITHSTTFSGDFAQTPYVPPKPPVAGERPIFWSQHSAAGQFVQQQSAPGQPAADEPIAGRRFAAFLIDWLLAGTLNISIMIIGIVATYGIANFPQPPMITDYLSNMEQYARDLLVWSEEVTTAIRPFLILDMMLFYGFYLLRDAIGGKSPGKALLGLRVVRADDGEPIGALKSLLRNLIFIISSYCCCGLLVILEGILVLSTADSRRIGDRIAGTRVIRD